ncbi:MAG: redox-sensing transcriptional repressor Rex [Candidatus Tectomicrobia bacterium]|nr:redox-sensing transcriptional repressor Rex [Candidatus Tectomicrobia bacterium]
MRSAQKPPRDLHKRLAAYAAAIRALERARLTHVAPAEIARRAGVSEIQVAEDLGAPPAAARRRGFPLPGLQERLRRLRDPKSRIPAVTVGRLSTYARVLNRLEEEGSRVVSSAGLARRCGLNPAQIRKDLAYFGEFGVRGKGYEVRDLKANLRNILGVTRVWKVALVGAGNLGQALLSYRGFLAHGFTIDAVFDKFPGQVAPLKPGSPPVRPMEELPKVIREMDIRIGIVAVPSESAQTVANQLVEAGVKGILNFAPTQITASPHVKVQTVELGSELERLAFYLSQQPGAH